MPGLYVGISYMIFSEADLFLERSGVAKEVWEHLQFEGQRGIEYLNFSPTLALFCFAHTSLLAQGTSKPISIEVLVPNKARGGNTLDTG